MKLSSSCLNSKLIFIPKILLFIILSILLYHPTTMAVWVRSDMPIIKYDSTRWDNYHSTNPFVLFDNSKYKIWYTGNGGPGWKIGYGTSDNGINWPSSSLQINPILDLSGWEQHITQAVVLHENSIYKGWYSALTGATAKLGYATSDDGMTNWSRNPPIFAGVTGKWDERVTDRGLSIVKVGSIYHLWYAASNSDVNWRIGYATSPDGINWTRYSDTPVISKTEPSWEYDNMMYPFVLYEDGKFKMWYGTGTGDSCTRYAYAESTNGYEWTKPADKNPVYDASGIEGAFDKFNVAGLSLVREGDTYKIWYSGYDGVHWSIGYATSPADPLPPATPTPTPLEPVVIVPGVMASWNKEGVLEGQTNPSTPWKLLPFVKEYDGLVQTLKNLGYQENKNFFLWPYDWRKPVETASQQLNQFIEKTVKPKNPGSKIHLVGHSLGGLVTRAWSQTGTNSNQIHHLVSVATPHKGTIQPYKAWEAGEVSQENNFLSLAGRMIIELNRRAFATTRQAIQNQFPVLKDLLPTEPYLKRQLNGSFVSQADMAVWNAYLSNLNTNALSIYPILDTLKGAGFPQTPYTYTIVAPSWLDMVLGNWKDGKVVDQENADGDTVVAASRASLDDPSIFLSQNHSNTIASTDGVGQILQLLEIPANVTDIVSGQATTIQPGLLFLLRSPATLEVVFNSQTYTDFDGIIFIPGASSGTYEATVTGTGPGTYRLVVAQFSDGSYSWKEYVDTTSPHKKTKYIIPYNQTAPKEDPATNLTDKERLEEIDIQLSNLSKLTKNLSIPKARFNLKIAMSALSKKDYYTVKRQLEQILQDLSSFRKSNPAEAARLKSFAVSDTLIDAYQAIFSQKRHVIDEGSLNRLQTFCNYEEMRLSKILENKSKSGKNSMLKVQLFNEGKSYKARAGKTTGDEKAKKYILLFQTQLLFREIGI